MKIIKKFQRTIEINKKRVRCMKLFMKQKNEHVKITIELQPNDTEHSNIREMIPYYDSTT